MDNKESDQSARVEESQLSRYGSRKFLLVLFTIALSGLLVWFEKIDAGVFSVVTVAALGGYLAANVTQKATIRD